MYKSIKLVLALALFAALTSGGCGGSSTAFVGTVESENERMIQAMTLEEKVGQLFIIRPEHLTNLASADYVHYNRGSWDYALTEEMAETLKQYPVGGFVFFSQNLSTPEQVRQFTADLDAASEIKPFIAVDEEGGIVRRIGRKFSADVEQIGTMQSIGETGDPQNAYNAAYAIGGYVKDFGFNLDFAPVADVNTNPDNIVIGSRAFGSDPDLVSVMVSAYLDGLHAQKIMGTIKHFPGHGDTSSDTHSEYAAVYKTWDELLQAELIPFMDNFDNTDMIMTAHITMKNVTSDDLPATLSHELMTNKLRKELGYTGVLVTDSMEMAAIREYYPHGESSVMAIEAGNDIVVCPYDFRESINAIVSAVKSGRISEERIDESVRRIFALKFKEEYQE